MVIHTFPPLETADSDGLLAIGGDLEMDSLKKAYSQGIFPWPTDPYPLLWFAPPKRTILEFSELKIPKRLQRELKKMKFHFEVDMNFSRVIGACAEGITRDSDGTWITPAIQEAFIRFHEMGYAHSFECYNEENQLVGGMYGVSIGQMFAGESMFYWESGASKATFLYACDFLKNRGATWLDCQTMSPLVKSFGAKEISRGEFMKRLKKALVGPDLFPFP
jgi:leucyl/phenylalanyl-tRNA--protein transferase